MNTFGVASEATGVLQATAPVAGIAASGAEVVATGTFAAPSTSGFFRLFLENVRVNLLVEAWFGPQSSVVEPATVVIERPAIEFYVECRPNLDGSEVVDVFDLLLLLQQTDSGVFNMAADFNADGLVNVVDVTDYLTDAAQGCGGAASLSSGGGAFALAGAGAAGSAVATGVPGVDLTGIVSQLLEERASDGVVDSNDLFDIIDRCLDVLSDE